MVNYILGLNPVIQTILACTITWLITLIGSSLVFFFKRINKTVMDIALSISSGVMIAASFFSLIMPSITMAEELHITPWIVISIGFLLGGLLLFVGAKIYECLTKNKSGKRCFMLITSITLHNIPEGMAIGVAFGSALYNHSLLIAAWSLAIGIGIQNFPEGSAVSIPLRREGMTRKKAFFLGMLSGFVEPIAGFIGAILVIKIKLLLPLLLAFAAGAMIYVVVEELIPESQTNKKKDLMALFTLIGFIVMMILDITLG